MENNYTTTIEVATRMFIIFTLAYYLSLDFGIGLNFMLAILMFLWFVNPVIKLFIPLFTKTEKKK